MNMLKSIGYDTKKCNIVKEFNKQYKELELMVVPDFDKGFLDIQDVLNKKKILWHGWPISNIEDYFDPKYVGYAYQ